MVATEKDADERRNNGEKRKLSTRERERELERGREGDTVRLDVRGGAGSSPMTRHRQPGCWGLWRGYGPRRWKKKKRTDKILCVSFTCLIAFPIAGSVPCRHGSLPPFSRLLITMGLLSSDVEKGNERHKICRFGAIIITPNGIFLLFTLSCVNELSTPCPSGPEKVANYSPNF